MNGWDGMYEMDGMGCMGWNVWDSWMCCVGWIRWDAWYECMGFMGWIGCTGWMD